MAANDETTPGAIAFRMRSVESRLKDHGAEIDEIERRQERHDEQINGDGGVVRTMNRVVDEFKALKRAVWTAVFALVVAVVVFALQIASAPHS